MMKFGCCPAMGKLPATLMILGTVLLITACGSGGSNKTAMEVGPGDTEQLAELGEWNSLTAGSLDISDGNNVLRAHYDSSGGHVVAAAPIQPAGTGTATWTGMWSGRVEHTEEDLASWTVLQVGPGDLEGLGGSAQISAYFENGGVEAELTYEGIGLPAIGLSELTSDRVSVTDGRFRPGKTHMFSFPFSPGPTHPGPTQPDPTEAQVDVTGAFTGEGAFGGTDAKGVVGYIGGDLSLSYGLGPRSLGTFQSVFYGTMDEN